MVIEGKYRPLAKIPYAHKTLPIKHLCNIAPSFTKVFVNFTKPFVIWRV